MHLPGKLFIFVAMLEILLVANYSEGRYLPTRGHGDNLEKLRELMYQILESSDENQNDQQQQRLAYARHPSWSKQSVLPDNDLPQLFGSSSKSRYSGGGGGGGGANHGYDTERLYS